MRPLSVRCAIYTRKSSEEGLDQAFNSLDAQREACEAYVLSQAGEGWSVTKDRYDDGGISGGTMERPALKRLLADIAAGKVDTVVVYKIDRLTRSLSDFARIVEVLDRAGASFVSVTQAFNTTTSMGRLTLNVLLSFAQFEREVTGERIRDKIAASKAKGMWMGGNLPLGYDLPTDKATRRLVVNAGEVETVRLIFRRYLEHGSVSALEKVLHREGISSKAWTSTRGRSMGGLRFSRGALFHLLKNRIYLGEIVHKDAVYPNAHQAIIDHALFEAVQVKLKDNAAVERQKRTGGGTAALTGLIVDAASRPMSPTVSLGRGGRSYRYYVSSPLQKGGSAIEDDTLRRISGQLTDELVLETVARLRRVDVTFSNLRNYVRQVAVFPDHMRLILIRDQTIDPDRDLATVRRRLAGQEQAMLIEHEGGLIQVVLPVRLKVRGGRSWIAEPDGRSAGTRQNVDPVLIGGLSRAHQIAGKTGLRGDRRSPPGPTKQVISSAYDRALVEVAFLAPDIQAAIVAGSQPAGLRLEHLLRGDVPLAWADQRAKFGF
jgi:DNA invertase Pin-like site-specific DNA recombinase